MAVDYADKKPKRPKRKPGATRRKPAKSAKPPARPLGLIAVAVLIIGLFVAGLVWLKQRDDGPQSPVIFTDEPATTQQQAAQDDLPAAPEERWRYIRELENHEVEVIIPDRQESQRRLMQCGSFRREGDAQALRAQIAMAGFEAQVRQTQSSQHGIWYRVILGPFDGLRPAQSANNQLRRNNIHGCQIWLWNLD